METMHKSQRIPNFEILRVLSMYFIVVWHYLYHGLMTNKSVDLAFGTTYADITRWVGLEVMMIITAIAVNLFVMITGYFMVKSSQRWNKLLPVWFQVFFYSFVIYLFLCSVGQVDFSFKGLIRSSLVVRFSAYWFVVKYLALLIVAPFLNKVLLSLSKRQYILLIVVLLVLDFDLMGKLYGHLFSGGQSLLHFILVYTIAGYIRLFTPPVWQIHDDEICVSYNFNGNGSSAGNRCPVCTQRPYTSP